MDKRHFPLIMCCTGGGGSPLMVALPVLMGLWKEWWMAKASLVPPLLASLEHCVIKCLRDECSCSRSNLQMQKMNHTHCSNVFRLPRKKPTAHPENDWRRESTDALPKRPLYQHICKKALRAMLLGMGMAEFTEGISLVLAPGKNDQDKPLQS